MFKSYKTRFRSKRNQPATVYHGNLSVDLEILDVYQGKNCTMVKLIAIPELMKLIRAVPGNPGNWSRFSFRCPSHYFLCKDKGACIDPIFFQDGTRHCKDGSDEPCPPNFFPCSDSSKCIPMKRFQDGVQDCDDGSDEECTTSQLECACGIVRCVAGERVGDDFWDCEDGSDELLNITQIGIQMETAWMARDEDMALIRYWLVNYNSVLTTAFAIVVGGSWRCVCQRGSVRLPGSARCIPISEVENYLNEPIMNCTETRQELRLRFNSSSVVRQHSMTSFTCCGDCSWCSFDLKSKHLERN
ncbi:Low-density lipoprotein receptor domain class A [Dictyocaulus viviparus]|uniref:Low-density lipoprotein receptor domain class A n=1 Tax=Dictyocaulus viviparus TaxID=29172 RepID=A0A0D8Y391_DICVI|nr:Low-density lipoprotein receptor domain class A [Dictyocaulus viviparus]